MLCKLLLYSVLPACLAVALARPAVCAESNAVQISEAISGPGLLAVASSAVILPLLEDGKDGLGESLRSADAIVSATVVTEVLKQIVREKRPHGPERDSFPSEHATAAFAAATMLADRQPDQAPYWYGAAALIAYSRVRLDLHRTQDVVAGAVVGYGIAKLERQLPRGMLIAPFVNPGGGGVELTWRF